MQNIPLEFSSTKFIDLGLVTRMSVVHEVHNKAVLIKFWAGSNVEIASVGVTCNIPALATSTAIAAIKRLAILKIKYDPLADGIVDMAKVLADAEEYATDNFGDKHDR